jgi:Domain of unknown function (DUF1707)
VPGSQYSGYADHPWHHYLAGGPASFMGLVLPLLIVTFLALVLGAGRGGAHRARTLLDGRQSRPPSLHAAHPAPPLLASDLERDEAASRVSDAVGEGRLSIEEGVQRIDAVLRSRHRHEIGTLLADLPTGTPATISRPLAAAPPRLGLLAVAAVVIVAAMLVQVLVGLWELWPVGVVALGGATLLPRRSTPVVRAA